MAQEADSNGVARNGPGKCHVLIRATITMKASQCLVQPPSQVTRQSPKYDPTVTGVRRRRNLVSSSICVDRIGQHIHCSEAECCQAPVRSAETMAIKGGRSQSVVSAFPDIVAILHLPSQNASRLFGSYRSSAHPLSESATIRPRALRHHFHSSLSGCESRSFTARRKLGSMASSTVGTESL
jgi:hypothetical protein